MSISVQFLIFEHSFLLLLHVVGALKSNKSLQELHLTNNLLNSYQDALQLGDLLHYNTTLLKLELSHNYIADAGRILIFVRKKQGNSILFFFPNNLKYQELRRTP